MTISNTPSTEHFVDSNGLRLHVLDWGGPDTGPGFVLVHGLASNARIWSLVAPRLAARRRTIALDQRGHGRSDKPDSGYDYASVAADLAGVIGALGLERPIVVGHSWGASVAVQYAADYADHVSGVVLVDGATMDFQGRMTLEEALVRLAPPRLAGTPLGEFLPRVRARWEPLGWNDEIEAAVMANFQVDEQARIAPNLTFERHLLIVREMWSQQLAGLYARIQCPALIVPADAPPTQNAAEAAQWQAMKRRGVDAAAAAIPNAQVVWALDTVHDIPLHRPEWLAEQLLAFAAEL